MKKPKTGLPTGRVLVGDAAKRLAEVSTASLDTVLSSPPYFMLRDYQVPGQLGLEGSVEQWVDGLVPVLAHVARVLKPTGSLWLNLGDTYSRHHRHGACPKSLVLGPERLLLHLLDEGWSLRNKIVWAKPNAAPASARDRFSCSWEGLYLLTRARHYYFDLDAVRVAHTTSPRLRRTDRSRRQSKPEIGKPTWSGPLAGDNSGLARLQLSGRVGHVLGGNPGDVWNVPKANFRGAHFATFPEALIKRPLLAGCPERVCSACGAPWWPTRWAGDAAIQACRFIRGLGRTALGGVLRKSCGCPGRAWRPGVVCDPFLGAGTTALVAEALGRRWVGIELNSDFADLAEQRLAAQRAGRRTRTSSGLKAAATSKERKEMRHGTNEQDG